MLGQDRVQRVDVVGVLSPDPQARGTGGDRAGREQVVVPLGDLLGDRVDVEVVDVVTEQVEDLRVNIGDRGVDLALVIGATSSRR